ncbi:MAG TPA: hypothetical protein PLI07_07875, partial [Candidatus Hydrogenedentes bacterium]|nr:hypothetical protein [Candidatus Hydrogenedentota bacterium]
TTRNSESAKGRSEGLPHEPGEPRAPRVGAAWRQRFVAAMGKVNPLVVLFFLCVLFALLTFIVPVVLSTAAPSR